MQGRRVVVTGSGRGIGAAIAEAFADQGASVVVTSRTQDQLETVCNRIRSTGGTAYPVVCDVTSDDDVERLAQESEQLLGGSVDVLINNAGVYHSARFEDHSIQDWQWVMDVNVIATIRVTQAFLSQLLQSDAGRLVFIASIAGKKPSYGQAAYNASKHAQIAMTRCMALEYGRTNLRVNAICPGFIKTDLIDLDTIAATHQQPVEDMWNAIEGASTIGRTVNVEEVAALAVYLASNSADGMNGQSIALDGGISYA